MTIRPGGRARTNQVRAIRRGGVVDGDLPYGEPLIFPVRVSQDGIEVAFRALSGKNEAKIPPPTSL